MFGYLNLLWAWKVFLFLPFGFRWAWSAI